MDSQCHYCDRVATKLCDGRVVGTDKTCDRPLCDFHAHQAGNLFVCVRGRKSRQQFGRVETVDYCPECREHKRRVPTQALVDRVITAVEDAHER